MESSQSSVDCAEDFEKMTVGEPTSRLMEIMDNDAPEILMQMERSSVYDCIALLSKQKSFTAKMVKIVREKMLLAFNEREVALQKGNKAVIKACILNGFDRQDQRLYKAVLKLKNAKCPKDSELAKQRIAVKSIQNRIDYIFRQLLNEVYGDPTVFDKAIENAVTEEEIDDLVKRLTPTKEKKLPAVKEEVKKPTVNPIAGGGPAKKANAADEDADNAETADEEDADEADDESADDEDEADEDADKEGAVKYADAAVNTETDEEIIRKIKKEMEQLGVATNKEIKIIVETIGRCFEDPEQEVDEQMMKDVIEVVENQYKATKKSVDEIRHKLNKIVHSRKDLLDIVKSNNGSKSQLFRSAMDYAIKLSKK